MKPCFQLLDELGIPYEVKIESAARVPNVGQKWVLEAHERGVRAIIVAAGRLANLGGVLAAHTALPVIVAPSSDYTRMRDIAPLPLLRVNESSPSAILADEGSRSAAELAVRIINRSL